jgi:predicted nucleic acid-binding protein
VVFPAFIDTNVLFGAYLCDTMLCLAEAGTYRPLWSAGVMDELERNLLERGLPSEAITHRLAEMTSAFPDAQVTGYEALIERMACDPKDKHVLAAAVRADAEVFVTFNDKHFPELATASYDVVVVTPDDFLLDQLDLYPGITVGALGAQARGHKSPPMSVEELLGYLARAQSPQFRSGGPAASATADAVRQGCSLAKMRD